MHGVAGIEQRVQRGDHRHGRAARGLPACAFVGDGIPPCQIAGHRDFVRQHHAVAAPFGLDQRRDGGRRRRRIDDDGVLRQRRDHRLHVHARGGRARQSAGVDLGLQRFFQRRIRQRLLAHQRAGAVGDAEHVEAQPVARAMQPARFDDLPQQGAADAAESEKKEGLFVHTVTFEVPASDRRKPPIRASLTPLRRRALP